METISIYAEDFYDENEVEIIEGSRCGHVAGVWSKGKHNYPGIRATTFGLEYYGLPRLESFEDEEAFRKEIRRTIIPLLQRLRQGKLDRLIAVDNTFNIIKEVIDGGKG